jgi:signal transduction histidine kinase
VYKASKASSWFRVVLHVILPAGLSILLFVGIVFGLMMPKFEAALIQEKRVLIKELAGSVCDLLGHYHQRTISGELTVEEAQDRVLKRIRAMHYGPENKGYFWIHDLEPRMVMHPYRPDLEGRNIAGLKDSEGTPLILEMNRTVQEQPSRDGYVDYLWQWMDEADTEVPKFSYVRLFEPWGWVVGTGVYLKDVHAEVALVTRGFRHNLYIAFLIIAVFCGYLITRGVRGEVQRQQSQQRLHEAFERFKTVMDAINTHITVIDIDTYEVLFMNESAKKTFGEGVGRLCWQVLQRDQRGPCDFCPKKELVDASGRPRGSYQWEFQDAATQRWYACLDQMIRWVDGRWVRLEIASDISDRKKAEQERECLLKSLAHKNEELESIVYIASHDLRSPLINIQGFAGELERAFGEMSEILEGTALRVERPRLGSLLTDEIPESLRYIQAGTEKMQMLVNGLLQLSRLGIATVEVEAVDMQALIREVLYACQYQINSQGGEVLYDALPSCMGDRKLVNQVFTNLIDNALKYADPSRQVVIRLTGRVTDGQVEYAVADNGMGIEEAHLSRIFDIFCRGNVQPSSDGLGLGLTIVKRILDILQGQVRVESEYGKGTTFYVTLPAVT